MNLRRHIYVSLSALLLAGLNTAYAASPEERYVPDPAIEQAINDALSPDRAVAYPAYKKLSEMGVAAHRALDNRLFNEKTPRGRVQLAEIIARACEGRVAFRMVLELNPDGSGKLRIESDRTMLVECSQKFDKIHGQPPTEFDPDTLRSNPYSESKLAQHLEGSMKYIMGESVTRDDRVFVSGDVSFTNFDDLAAFANNFDKNGYYLLKGMTLGGTPELSTLRFKKGPDQSTATTRYLLRFHDVKWQFVLDFKGKVESNAMALDRNKQIWTFNCAQMLAGEAEIEARFDPRQSAAQRADLVGNGLQAIPAVKYISVIAGQKDADGKPLTRGPDYEVVLDGRPSTPAVQGLEYQWLQTSGIPLDLPKEAIARALVRMLIYQPGEYRFELAVSKDGKTSAPAEVVVLVGSDHKPDLRELQKTVAGAAKNGLSTQKTIEYEFNNGKSVAVTPRPPIQPQPTQPQYTPEPVVPNNVRPTPVPAGLELSLIREVEQEFQRAVAGSNGGGNVVIPNPPIAQAPTQPVIPPAPTPAPPIAVKPENNVANNDVKITLPDPKDVVKITPPEAPKEVVAKTTRPAPELTPDGQHVRNPFPAAPQTPTLSAQPSTFVAVNKATLDEIRRTEAEFTTSRNAGPPPEGANNLKPENTNLKPVEPEANPVKPVQPEIKKPEVKPEIKKESETAKNDLKEFEAALNKLNPQAAPKPEPLPPPKDNASINPSPVQPAPPTPPAETKVAAPEAPKVAVPQPATVPSKAKIGSTLEEGVALLKAGEFVVARDTLKRALANHPTEDTQVLLGIAMLFAAEKPDGYDRAATLDAYNLFNEVYAKNQKNVTATMYGAHAMARLDNLQQSSYLNKMGTKMGGKAVAWEYMWQYANKSNKMKDPKMAETMLLDAEKNAGEAGIKDPRIYRELTWTYIGLKDEEKAVKAFTSLMSLGCDDPALREALKNAKLPAPGTVPLEVAPATNVANNKPTEQPKPVEPNRVVEAPKPVEPQKPVEAPKPPAPVVNNVTPAPKPPETPKTVTPPTPSVVKNETPKIAPATPDNRSDIEKRFEAILNGKTPEPVAANSGAKEEPVKPLPPANTVKESRPTLPANPVKTQTPPIPNKVESPAPVVTPPKPAAQDKKPEPPKAPTTVEELELRAKNFLPTTPAPGSTVPKNNTAPAVPTPAPQATKIPPVPESFTAALDQGRRALERGKAILAKNGDAGKAEAQEQWEIAEAMLRGAWNVRGQQTAPEEAEKELTAQFTELSKYAGAIALVSSRHLISKKNGLVVLNAEPSVVYGGKTLYYAWEQKDGPELDLRRENLASKKLGLKIKEPGTYVFELVVSDGNRGGNPVTVTVEVQDRGF